MDKAYFKQYRLSQYINVIRNFLVNKGFFDHHLYSTTDYKIEETDTFMIKKELYLRYNPEPDIWQVGQEHNNFFWIGSMYRDESKIDETHQNEFTVADIYQANSSQKQVISLFKEILFTLEERLRLSKLSTLDFYYISHDDFNTKNTLLLKDGWYVVTDYPEKESFYDSLSAEKGKTQKFEIYMVKSGSCVEITACGKVGPNTNENNRILKDKMFINSDILSKNFWGFGFGLERLIVLYEG